MQSGTQPTGGSRQLGQQVEQFALHGFEKAGLDAIGCLEDRIRNHLPILHQPYPYDY